MAVKRSTPRNRVLVDLGGPGEALYRAVPASKYHRGKRLRELAQLGLAAELAGLAVEIVDGRPMLRGHNLAIVRLDGSLAEGAAVASAPSPAAAAPLDVVMPAGFVDQFLD